MWDKGYLPTGEGVDYTSRDPISNLQAACDNDDDDMPKLQMAVFQCFIIHHSSPGCLFSATLNFPHLSASQNLNDEKSPQVPKLSPKYGPDSNYCGLKSVPSLQATNQINAQCFWRGAVLCSELRSEQTEKFDKPQMKRVWVPIEGWVGEQQQRQKQLLQRQQQLLQWQQRQWVTTAICVQWSCYLLGVNDKELLCDINIWWSCLVGLSAI